MNAQPSLRAILSTIIAENGGLARIGAAAKSFALLVALGFAGVMPLAAGYELYRVHDVSRWPINYGDSALNYCTSSPLC